MLKIGFGGFFVIEMRTRDIYHVVFPIWLISRHI